VTTQTFTPQTEWFPQLPIHSWWKENFDPDPDQHKLYSDYLERVLLSSQNHKQKKSYSDYIERVS
jgi:hypothetical protein